jgi:hypothetical protein
MQVGCPIDRVPGPFIQFGEAMAERGIVDALLRAVVEIGGALGDVSALRNLFHRRAVEPVFAEDLDRGVEQRVPAIFDDHVRLRRSMGLPVMGVLMTMHSVK